MKEVAVITGGTGTIGSVLASGLVEKEFAVVILGRKKDAAEEVARSLRNAGGEAMAVSADVLDRNALESAAKEVLDAYGRIDHLINCAGGNMAGATVQPDGSLDDLTMNDFDKVSSLNLKGTLLPIIVFSKTMREKGKGNIINISSMAATRPLTRVIGYSAAKAGVDNLTKWLAVEFATKYSAGIRVNAVAPGFFVAKQNQALLLNKDGTLTPRGQTIIDHTPMGRFGKTEELCGVVNWLCGTDASFVTGAVIPVDGGFGAFSGV